MALTSIAVALAQYAENALWHESAAKASLALEALRYLRLHRAQAMGHTGSSLSYEAIESEIKSIEGFLGITGTTAPGKRRTGLYRIRRVS